MHEKRKNAVYISFVAVEEMNPLNTEFLARLSPESSAERPPNISRHRQRLEKWGHKRLPSLSGQEEYSGMFLEL